jgi:GT2 family glycosyltransferase
MSSVCVEIAVRDDPRLGEAMDSLARQTRKPDRVLIAASVDTPRELLESVVRAHPELVVRVARFPGGLIAARLGAQALIDEPTTAFLDSDEVAPAGWLEEIVAPVEAGTAAFSGGPTRPSHPARTSIERYMELLEAAIYQDLVPSRVTYLPLQNTAWRSDVLQSLGFDPRVTAEDHDVETRALRAGLRGVFLPHAWVYHDGGRESSLLRWARKRYHYLLGMAMCLLKNGDLGPRLSERRRPVDHWLWYVEAAMKPVALLHASIRWRRLRNRPVPTPAPVPDPAG